MQSVQRQNVTRYGTAYGRQQVASDVKGACIETGGKAACDPLGHFLSTTHYN